MKPDMLRNVYLVGGRVKAPIPMMRGAVTKKDTCNGPKIHFVLIVGSEMRETLAPKNFKK